MIAAILAAPTVLAPLSADARTIPLRLDAVSITTAAGDAPVVHVDPTADAVPPTAAPEAPDVVPTAATDADAGRRTAIMLAELAWIRHTYAELLADRAPAGPEALATRLAARLRGDGLAHASHRGALDDPLDELLDAAVLAALRNDQEIRPLVDGIAGLGIALRELLGEDAVLLQSTTLAAIPADGLVPASRYGAGIVDEAGNEPSAVRELLTRIRQVLTDPLVIGAVALAMLLWTLRQLVDDRQRRVA